MWHMEDRYWAPALWIDIKEIDQYLGRKSTLLVLFRNRHESPVLHVDFRTFPVIHAHLDILQSSIAS